MLYALFWVIPRHSNSSLIPSQNFANVRAAGRNGEPSKVHDCTVDSCLDLKEVTEQTAVNCTVDVSGEKL